MWKNYAQNGKLLETGPYHQGMKNGKWSFYNERNKLARVQNFKDDIQDGAFVEYYPNGKKNYQGAFSDREKIGIWSWWDTTGKLVRRVEYHKNKIVRVLVGER